MKSKDYVIVFIIAVVSACLSFFLSSYLIPSGDKQQSAEVVEKLDSTFNRPPELYFNDNSVNPSQEILIEEDPGSNPFSRN